MNIAETDYLYGTHKSVLEALFDKINIVTCLEIGMGSYSTPLLIWKCKEVHSIEKNHEWYDKVVKMYGSKRNWYPVLDYTDIQYNRFDMIFVDGERFERAAYMNRALEMGVPIVILHDSELVDYYHLNLIDVPDTYARFDFQYTTGKQTTVFTNEYADIISKLTPTDHTLLHESI